MQVTDTKPGVGKIPIRLLLATITIAMFGYIDYITGEISIGVLYILCLIAVTWYTGTFIALLCVLEIISANITADFYDNVKMGSHVYEWNALGYLLIYLVVCLLVGRLKKVLTS